MPAASAAFHRLALRGGLPLVRHKSHFLAAGQPTHCRDPRNSPSGGAAVEAGAGFVVNQPAENQLASQP